MFTIYSKPNCTYCDQAKALFNQKQYPYNEIVLDIGQDQEDGKKYMPVADFKAMYPDAKTVPQIFLDSDLLTGEPVHIGGFSELRAYVQAKADQFAKV